MQNGGGPESMVFIRTWIINIITIMIVSAFAEIIIPDGSFKKYTKLVIGLIVMVIIIKPVIQLSNQEVLLHKLTLETGNYIEKMQVIEKSKMMEEKQRQQIISTYRSNLKSQVKQRVTEVCENYEAKVTVDTDTNIQSSGFGSIRGIEITLSPNNKNNVVAVVAPVEKIDISGQTFEKEKKPEETKEEQQLKTRILEYLHGIYSVPKENITINIQK